MKRVCRDRLVEIPSGRERPRIPQTGKLNRGYFVGDGRYLANATRDTALQGDANLHLFDTATGTELTSFHMEGLIAAEFADDGQRIVTWNGQTVRLLEAPTGKEVARWQKNPRVHWGSFDNQRRRLVIATEAGVVRIIDAASGRQLLESNVACEIDRIKLGEVLVVACQDGPVHSIEAETGRALSRFEPGGSVVEISPDAWLLLAHDNSKNMLKLVETNSGRQLVSVNTPYLNPLSHRATIHYRIEADFRGWIS